MREKTRHSKLPRILDDYLNDTGQMHGHGQLSESHLLNEAEWCLYNAYANEASAAYEYHPSSKAALERWVAAMRDKGVMPHRDFD